MFLQVRKFESKGLKDEEKVGFNEKITRPDVAITIRMPYKML